MLCGFCREGWIKALVSNGMKDFPFVLLHCHHAEEKKIEIPPGCSLRHSGLPIDYKFCPECGRKL
jgi:hypothetical protein